MHVSPFTRDYSSHLQDFQFSSAQRGLHDAPQAIFMEMEGRGWGVKPLGHWLLACGALMGLLFILSGSQRSGCCYSHITEKKAEVQGGYTANCHKLQNSTLTCLPPKTLRHRARSISRCCVMEANHTHAVDTCKLMLNEPGNEWMRQFQGKGYQHHLVTQAAMNDGNWKRK